MSEYFYEKIKRMAENKGMSLIEIAEKCGRGSNFFYQFKKRGMGLDTLKFWKRMSEELGTTLDELVKEL